MKRPAPGLVLKDSRELLPYLTGKCILLLVELLVLGKQLLLVTLQLGNLLHTAYTPVSSALAAHGLGKGVRDLTGK